MTIFYLHSPDTRATVVNSLIFPSGELAAHNHLPSPRLDGIEGCPGYTIYTQGTNKS